MDDRLHIAALLLGNLITSTQGKPLRDRLPDIQHCIKLADLLISECEIALPKSTPPPPPPPAVNGALRPQRTLPVPAKPRGRVLH